MKNNKSPGIDCIPNEVLKRPGIYFVLYKLFKAIFESSVVPSIWLCAIIKPIPKGCDKDPHVPMNYRGISLLSCISKVYTALLNERLVNFCNANDILVDEQNGF